jgi:hypothetical protein
MRRSRGAGALLAPIAVAGLVIACCAALPVVVGALAGLALGVAVGVGGGLLAAIALAAAIIALRARRRGCPGNSNRLPS